MGEGEYVASIETLHLRAGTTALGHRDEEFLGKAAVAAVLALTLGGAVLGVLTTLAAMSPSVAAALAPGGAAPLRGAVLLSGAVWLVSWSGLHALLRHRIGPSHGLIAWSGVLILVGVVGTSPSVIALLTSA